MEFKFMSVIAYPVDPLGHERRMNFLFVPG
jgi:hypothetical protein